MTPFAWLLVGHFVGDILLGQTDYEAKNKVRDWLPCLTHALKWTIAVGIASLIAGWDGNAHYLGWLLIMGLLHAVIDRRWPVLWMVWLKEQLPLGGSKTVPKDYPAFLMMWADQVLHLLQIAFLAALL